MIDATPKELEIIDAILQEHVPTCEVRVFGSRAKWTAKDHSDLDLAVVGEEKLDRLTIDHIKEAFEQSDLRFRIDVVDWHAISDRFRDAIEADCVTIRNRQNLESRKIHIKEVTDGLHIKLGNLIDVTRGRSYRSKDLQPNKHVALVTLKSFERGGGYKHEGLKPYVGAYKPEQVVRPGELVVAQTDITQNADVIGRPAIVLDAVHYDTLVASLDAAIVRNKAHSELDMSYLYYRMFARDYIEHIKAHSTGTTVLHLSRNAIPIFELTLPPLREQRRIAHILGTLDDKIELNRRMNETLEEMARAIFKDWFVDFGPVRAKMEGREPYLPDEVWKLFPDRLVDSELGEIPEGWEVKELDEIANYRNGLALQKFRPKENEERLPVVKIAQLRSGKADSGEWATARITDECVIDDGDIVFSWSGSLMIKVWSGGRAALNQHLFKVTSSEYPKWLYFHFTKLHLGQFQSIAADKATTMGHIKRQHLRDAKCALPSEDVVEAADQMLTEMLGQIISNDIETRRIVALRDDLLPRLVSEEISNVSVET